MNFNIFGGFEKNEFFWGYEDFVDIFFFLGGGGGRGVITKLYYIGVISMHFRGFLLREWYKLEIFWGLLKFHFFLGGGGGLKFLIYFLGEG